jgi:hypothetical protein
VAWGFVGSASANLSLDKQFYLESIGILKASDSLGGLFAEIIASAYVDYFNIQKRFVLTDLSRVQQVIGQFELEHKLIENVHILAEIARVSKSTSLIRTQVLKEPASYHFKIDWLHAPLMERIAKIEFFLAQPDPGNALKTEIIKKAFQDHLGELFSQLPFLGEVTGRDSAMVTLNLGATSGLLPGSFVEISTLEEVKKHPILNEMVSWELVPTGKVRVEHVEESLSFGKVITELDHQKVLRYQKITHIEAPSVPKSSQTEESVSKSDFSNYHNGLIAGGIVFGNASYSYRNGGVFYESQSFLTSIKLQSEIWFSESWFTLLDFYYASFRFTQKNSYSNTLSPRSQIGGSFGSWSSLNIGMGYLQPIFENVAQIRLKWGYQLFLYEIPWQGSPEYTATINNDSLWMGIQGDYNLNSFFNVFLGFNRGIIPFRTSYPWLSASQGSSWSEWQAGVDYLLKQELKLRLSLDIQSSSLSSFTSLVDQKIFTLGPSVLYLF